jgi:hypothetical protein
MQTDSKISSRAGQAFLGAVLASCLLLLGGCAAPVVADGWLLARTDAVLRAGQPDAVRLTISPETVATGELVTARVSARVAGYLHLYQVGTDGKTLTLVFPNAYDDQNAVSAGEVFNLPRPNWRLRANGPEGVGYLLAVLTEKQQSTSTLAKAAGDGRFQLEGAYAASMVTLKETRPR